MDTQTHIVKLESIFPIEEMKEIVASVVKNVLDEHEDKKSPVQWGVMRRDAVIEKLGISSTTLQRAIDAGKISRGFNITSRVRGWDVNEVMEVYNKMKAGELTLS